MALSLPSLPAQHVPTAAEYAQILAAINAFGYARKSADETVTTSTTLQNDDELFVAVNANGIYEFRLFLDYNSSTTADIKIGWTLPSGATMTYVQNGLDASSTTNLGAQNLGPLTQASNPVFGGTGGDTVAIPLGMLVVGANAGTMQLQWAQSTSSGSTIVRAGSHLIVRQLA